MIRIDQDGIKFFCGTFVFTVCCYFISNCLFYIGVAASIWMLYFFRDPVRKPPKEDDVLVSPADGTVVFLSDATAPTEIAGFSDKAFTKVSIFMSVFNVHVNRSVASGVIEKIVYMPGKFFNASFDKASEWNERNSFVLSIAKHGSIVIFTQIAGLIARRIRCDVVEKKSVETGQKVGIIRFGSRLDVYIPTNMYDINVHMGQKTVAGETIIAKLKAKN